ncbi:MAG: 6-hydroxymethylpterin diphosphokinase MptE-like protein [Verrucomicrobiota bacterium]
MKRYLYFGAGIVFQEMLEAGKIDHEIVGILDNDPAKAGQFFHSYPVYAPQDIHTLKWDAVVISSVATQANYRQIFDFGNTEYKFLAPLLSQKNRDHWNKLKNRHCGETVFIVGNGPSLSIEDLDILHDKKAVCFAFNKIYMAFGLTPFRPRYFLVEDDLVVENNREALRRLSGFIKFYPDNFLPCLGPPDDETVLFHIPYPPVEAYQPGFSSDPLWVWPGYSVTHSAIQLSVWMGAARIILLGVDFSFSVQNSEQQVLIGDGAQDHFLPNYRPQGEKWNTPRLEETKRAYEFARSYCDENGIEILNATRGGKLEVFPRISLESSLGLS